MDRIRWCVPYGVTFHIVHAHSSVQNQYGRKTGSNSMFSCIKVLSIMHISSPCNSAVKFVPNYEISAASQSEQTAVERASGRTPWFVMSHLKLLFGEITNFYSNDCLESQKYQTIIDSKGQNMNYVTLYENSIQCAQLNTIGSLEFAWSTTATTCQGNR